MEKERAERQDWQCAQRLTVRTKAYRDQNCGVVVQLAACSAARPAGALARAALSWRAARPCAGAPAAKRCEKRGPPPLWFERSGYQSGYQSGYPREPRSEAQAGRAVVKPPVRSTQRMGRGYQRFARAAAAAPSREPARRRSRRPRPAGRAGRLARSEAGRRAAAAVGPGAWGVSRPKGAPAGANKQSKAGKQVTSQACRILCIWHVPRQGAPGPRGPGAAGCGAPPRAVAARAWPEQKRLGRWGAHTTDERKD